MKEESTKISALLITYNEINHVNDVIDNIDFADEIIVIDSYSNDGSYEKLKSLNTVKVIQHKFYDFASQRNFAINQATYNWILFIDADERITSTLKNEILNTIKNPKDFVAFKFKRNFFFENKIMRFSGLQTDSIYRLFKKGTAKYNESRIVHEQLEVSGKSSILKNKMLHYSFSDYESYKSKTEHYAKLKAQELFKKGIKPNFLLFYFKPLYKFISNYIFRLGVLDGKAGYTICYLNAYGVHYRYIELKKLLS